MMKMMMCRYIAYIVSLAVLAFAIAQDGPPSDSCREKMRELCFGTGKCQPDFQCMKTCAMKHKEELSAIGCDPPDRSRTSSFFSNDCRMKIRELCGPNTSSNCDDAMICVKQCRENNKDELEQSGCDFSSQRLLIVGPAWTYGAMEEPREQRDFGTWKGRVYDREQQKRLSVNPWGQPADNLAKEEEDSSFVNLNELNDKVNSLNNLRSDNVDEINTYINDLNALRNDALDEIMQNRRYREQIDEEKIVDDVEDEDDDDDDDDDDGSDSERFSTESFSAPLKLKPKSKSKPKSKPKSKTKSKPKSKGRHLRALEDQYSWPVNVDPLPTPIPGLYPTPAPSEVIPPGTVVPIPPRQERKEMGLGFWETNEDEDEDEDEDDYYTETEDETFSYPYSSPDPWEPKPKTGAR